MSPFSPACYARVYIKISAGMFPFHLSINTMQMLMLECITAHEMIYILSTGAICGRVFNAKISKWTLLYKLGNIINCLTLLWSQFMWIIYSVTLVVFYVCYLIFSEMIKSRLGKARSPILFPVTSVCPLARQHLHTTAQTMRHLHLIRIPHSRIPETHNRAWRNMKNVSPLIVSGHMLYLSGSLSLHTFVFHP